MFAGCYTAVITPEHASGRIDYSSLRDLVDFQTENGVNGIVAAGTTGESSTMTESEHIRVIEKINEYLGSRGTTIGGTGSNSTEKTLKLTRHAYDAGVKAALLVDPYYNGPSSLEIRKEYVSPVAAAFPDVQIIPYIIPGRCGTQMLPQDLAALHSQFPNVRAVKEATGDSNNMKLTRKMCGSDFDILSGDDGKTYEMMTTPEIKASGVISVASNVAPKAVKRLVSSLSEGHLENAQKQAEALAPLFGIITVKTEEETPFGPSACRARNPLPYKTLMNILGMPSGSCRRPLGRMTKNGFGIVLEAARKTYESHPEILEPVEKFFGVDLSKRLYEEKYWEGLRYD
ncbi:MAG: 4-hydroxy-tetrahydrodipicolinate synthase [Candidatus Thermoplasmatota archaeon]|nr:4-hydroxy-tetrahydrodipicolinate synthase [Candidatus Thermoplasmatota archaeon]